MLINEHQVSKVTQLYDVLSDRLIPDIAVNKRFIANYLSGKQGELKFKEWLRQLGDECLILSDVTLANDETQCQMDFIVITHRKIIIYEVKNYRGTWDLKDGLLTLNSSLSLPSPLSQMKRAEAMLRTQLPANIKNHPIEIFGIFINENFKLTTTESREHLLECDHLSWHLLKLSQSVKPLTQQDWQLAESLMKLNKLDYVPAKLPAYSPAQIKRGLACPHCHTFNQNRTSRKLACLKCRRTTSARQAILYAAHEFELLFPHEKMTTAKIQTFIGDAFEHDSVLRAMKSKYTMVNGRRHAYFE